MKYKYIGQIDEADCGAACIAMVCSYYGKNIEVSRLKETVGTDRYGANMLGLYQAAQSLGFNAEGLSGTLSDLFSENITLPYIAHIVTKQALEHFVVIYEMNKDFFIIADPAKGIVTCPVKEFETMWTGHILTLIPNQFFKKERKKRHLLSFFKIALDYKKKFAYIALLAFASTMFSLFTSGFIYYLTDVIIPNESVITLFFLSAFIVIVHLAVLCFDLVRTWLTANLAKTLNCKIIMDYIKHLLNARYDFYENHTEGDLVSRMQDADIVREAISQIAVSLFLDVSMILVGLSILLYINLPLFAISLLIIVIYAMIIAYFNKPISKISLELRNCDSSVATSFLEMVKGIEVIKSYQMESYVAERNRYKINELMDFYCKGSVLFAKQTLISSSVVSIGEIIILMVGGMTVINGGLTLGTLLMFYMLFVMCLSPAKNSIDLLPVIYKAEVSAQRLKDVFMCPLDSRKTSGKIDPIKENDIIISNLSFRYGNRDLILDDISLEIKAGEKIVLMGESGAGKSTLTKLLLCYYPVEKGMIRIGNKEINEIPIGELRKRIAYVSQNDLLFCGTILDNIKMGNPNMHNTEIITLLDKTPFSGLISRFPMKYQTMVSENGKNLSGGQRQLVSIARAMIKQADILILDEPTSALDKEMEDIVYQTVFILCPSSTILLISHHLISAQRFDRIIRIKNGKIVYCDIDRKEGKNDNYK